MIDGEGARLGREAARRLAQSGCCEIAPGLTDAEFERIEKTYGFEFADDHRAFLTAGLPLNVPLEPEEGVSYAWKVAALAAVLAEAMTIARPTATRSTRSCVS